MVASPPRAAKFRDQAPEEGQDPIVICIGGLEQLFNVTRVILKPLHALYSSEESEAGVSDTDGLKSLFFMLYDRVHGQRRRHPRVHRHH